MVWASVTIPRAGTKVGELPVTLPIILYLLLLAFWMLRPLSGVKLRVSSGDLHSDLASRSAVAFALIGLVAVTVGLMRGAPPAQAMVETVALIGFVPVFFLIRRYIRDQHTFQAIITVLSVSLVVTCLYGIAQRAFGHYKVMVPGITMSYADALSPDAFALRNNMTAVGLKVVSTFQNGNLFGNYLALLLPVPAALFHHARGSRKTLHGVVLGLVLVTLLLTLSRGAIVAGMASLVTLGLLLRGALSLRILGLFLASAGGAVVYLIGVTERLFRFDPTLAGRTTIYDHLAGIYTRLSPLTFVQAVFLGAGMGANVGRGLFSTGGTEGSLLIIGMKMGVPGVLALLAVVFGVFLCTWRWCRPSDSFEGRLGCALAAGLVGASVQLAIDSVMMMPPTSMNFWIVAGLALAACSIVRQKELATA